ncbi:MAG: TlpA family protein disulfide reductase, partial [Candidatus Binatia bacterium]
FAVPALFLVLLGASGQGPSFADIRIYTTELVFGLILTAGVAGSLLLLKSILEKQSAILRRLEILEVIASDGASVQRDHAGDPNDGLPIGAVFPDFELPDVRGRVTTFDEVLAGGKATLFFFVAPTCQPCNALMPEIDMWRSELNDKINFIFITRGTPEENAEKFADGTEKTFLLQRDREFQDQVYAKWTPSALLVNVDGRVASHVASGDVAIRSLVEKLRTENVDDPFFYYAIGHDGVRTPKIGEPVPDFELSDLDGRTITANELHGKPTLVTFWSLTCPHCLNMAEQIKEWEKNRGVDDPNLLLFSDGTAEDHRDVGISSPILIDKAHEASAKFGMQGTPSGVLI